LKKPRRARRGTDAQETQMILRHWREAVPNDRLAHLVKDATRALLRALQMRLSVHGVPLGHWTFLRILWERDGITQRELSELAGVMEPTTFSALKTMQSLGYVVRRKLPGNKKKVFVFLTPKGRLLKSKLVPFAEEVNQIAARNIKAGEIATTRRTLLAIIENLAEDEVIAASRIRSTRALARLVAERGRDRVQQA
jgi:MarR family transcriptional regulator, organic hydroperoxide resistance regulator